MLSKSLLAASVLYLSASAETTTDSAKKPGDGTYDYVIVGGGTGGLAMAARLSEDPSVSVAVIEAGSYYQITNPLLSSTPAGDIAWSGSSSKDINPGVDWGFMSAAQSGANGRSIHYPRGKCLGGSSGRNFMIYQRPDKGSLQQWADAVGDDSYTWDKWLPYYKKSVKFSPPGATRFPNASQTYNPGTFEASGGPLRVSYPAWANAFSTWLNKAFEEIGLKPTNDFNSGELFGTGFLSATIDPYNGFRDSSQTSFLESSQGRPNLKVFYLTLAKKIIFDGKAARGVAVASGITIWAKKEVILSAGAFQTPQLLMVSGVGPAAELKKFNIPVVQDLPGVGQNMWDHVFFGPSYEVHTPTLQSVVLNPANLFVELTQNYFPKAEGILTNPVCDYLGWEKTPRDLITKEAATALGSFADSWPEIEYLSCPGYIGNYSSIMDSPTTNVASVVAALVAPKSRGTVTLKSADTADLPIIDPKWLTDRADQEVAVASYKRLRKLWATKALAANRVNGKEFWPGEKIATDAEVLNLVRDSMMTIFHASCTAKMGKKDDKMAVVDSAAKVYGVRNLRIVDASAFPLLPPGHPMSVVYALAEKISEQIKKGN